MFDEAKLGKTFGFDAFAEARHFDNIMRIVMDTVVADDAYVMLYPGKRPYSQKAPGGYVIVLDDDDDEERLKAKPLPEVHSSIIRIMDILEGPGVWEKLMCESFLFLHSLCSLLINFF
jgi:hypothetical protein